YALPRSQTALTPGGSVVSGGAAHTVPEDGPWPVLTNRRNVSPRTRRIARRGLPFIVTSLQLEPCRAGHRGCDGRVRGVPARANARGCRCPSALHLRGRPRESSCGRTPAPRKPDRVHRPCLTQGRTHGFTR